MPDSIFCTRLMYMILRSATLEQIRAFLKSRPGDVHICNDIGFGPLLLAALGTRTYASEALVQILIDHRADVNAVTKNGDSILSMVCTETDEGSTVGTVRILLECGANPNVCDSIGITPLIYASVYTGSGSNYETVELLLQFDADPNIRSQIGSTALTAVVTAGNVEHKVRIAKLLIDRGANVGLLESDNSSALHRACWFVGKRDSERIRMTSQDIEVSLELIELLVKHKADINVRSDAGLPIDVAKHDARVAKILTS